MHFVYSYTSGYFPIYDDDYRCVHYDDHGHGSTDLQTLLRTTSSTIIGSGCANCLGTHVRGSYVEKYYNPILSKQKASHIMILTIGL